MFCSFSNGSVIATILLAFKPGKAPGQATLLATFRNNLQDDPSDPNRKSFGDSNQTYVISVSSSKITGKTK